MHGRHFLAEQAPDSSKMSGMRSGHLVTASFFDKTRIEKPLLCYTRLVKTCERLHVRYMTHHPGLPFTLRAARWLVGALCRKRILNRSVKLAVLLNFSAFAHSERACAQMDAHEWGIEKRQRDRKLELRQETTLGMSRAVVSTVDQPERHREVKATRSLSWN